MFLKKMRDYLDEKKKQRQARQRIENFQKKIKELNIKNKKMRKKQLISLAESKKC